MATAPTKVSLMYIKACGAQNKSGAICNQTPTSAIAQHDQTRFGAKENSPKIINKKPEKISLISTGCPRYPNVRGKAMSQHPKATVKRAMRFFFWFICPLAESRPLRAGYFKKGQIGAVAKLLPICQIQSQAWVHRSAFCCRPRGALSLFSSYHSTGSILSS